MLISDLVHRLESIMADRGDLPVFHRDVDPYTGCSSEEDPELSVEDERTEDELAFPRTKCVLIYR